MSEQISRLLRDSEEDTVNETYWRIRPLFDMIREGSVSQLKNSLHISIGEESQLKRFGKEEQKEAEYMTVSLINTFMIAAITGGVYPPDANRIADQALHQLIHTDRPEDMNRLIRETAVQMCESVRKEKQQDSSNPYTEQAKQYIRTHLSQDIRIPDIAGHCGISPSRLSHLFSEHCGMTLKQYLIQERIEAAKELLKNTGSSVSAIASLLQFCDQSRFAAVFRKKTGMTPGEYRKQNSFERTL